MAKIKAEKSLQFTGSYTVPGGWVKEINFFDMSGKTAGTKGIAS